LSPARACVWTVSSSASPDSAMKKRRKILIVRMDRMGDLILSTPAIRAVRRGLPDAYIAVMVRPYNEPVVRNNPDIDEVIVYDKERKEKGIWGNARFAYGLFKKRFDTAVLLHTTNRAVLLSFIAGIKKIIGYDRRLRYLMTDTIPCDKHLGRKHEVEYCLDVVKKLGVDITGASRKPLLVVSEDDERTVDDILRKKGIGPCDRLVVVNPGASCPSRRWKTERYREVVRRLLQDGFRVAVIGVGAEAEIAAEVLRGLEVRALNLTGILSVGETAALIKRAHLLISNDTGPVHMASALGTAVVVIFGRKDPGLSPVVWGPIGENTIVLHKDAGCVTCLAHNCRNGFKCLDRVAVSDVIDSARRIAREGR